MKVYDEWWNPFVCTKMSTLARMHVPHSSPLPFPWQIVGLNAIIIDQARSLTTNSLVLSEGNLLHPNSFFTVPDSTQIPQSKFHLLDIRFEAPGIRNDKSHGDQDLQACRSSGTADIKFSRNIIHHHHNLISSESPCTANRRLYDPVAGIRSRHRRSSVNGVENESDPGFFS